MLGGALGSGIDREGRGGIGEGAPGVVSGRVLSEGGAVGGGIGGAVGGRVLLVRAVAFLGELVHTLRVL